MKAFYLNTLAVFFITSSLSLPAMSGVGNSSGNGDGDKAFALQKLATANPGLSPAQVLLKAFQESAGRIPTIQYAYIGRTNDKAYAKYVGTLFGAKERGIEFNFDNVQESAPTGVSKLLFFNKRVPDMGPLLQPQSGTETFYVSDKLNFAAVNGDVLNNGQSLVLGPKEGASQADPQASASYLELRSFNSKTVIFVIHPVTTETGAHICYPIGRSGYKTSKASDICAVGYFWEE